MAKKHEFANYDGRHEFIDANYGDLLSAYQSLLDDIGLELRARGVMELPEEVADQEEEDIRQGPDSCRSMAHPEGAF